MGYKPVLFSDCAFNFPEFNWQISLSVDIFNFADTTPYKVFWQVEPEEIRETEAKLIKNWKFYDLILTWNHMVLSQVPNSRLFPCGAVWNHESDTSQKKFGVSYLTSSKTDCAGHRYRQEIFDILPASEQRGRLPIFKHRSPPQLYDKRSILVPFQYSIIMENCQRPNYFTEKILDCFANKTIPIYWGCPNIHEFFDKEGILIFNNTHQLEKIVKNLDSDFYRIKHDVIEKNYEEAMKYKSPFDRVVKAVNESWAINPSKVHDPRENQC